MSREDVHKLIDKLLDGGYCGKVLIPCFKGNVGTPSLVEQSVKNIDDLLFLIVEA